MSKLELHFHSLNLFGTKISADFIKNHRGCSMIGHDTEREGPSHHMRARGAPPPVDLVAADLEFPRQPSSAEDHSCHFLLCVIQSALKHTLAYAIG